MRDDDATAERLGPQIEELLGDPDGLARDGAPPLAVEARPQAAEALAAWVLELADGDG